MSKKKTEGKYWLEFIRWSHNMAINQVGHGSFTYPHNDLFVEPTTTDFWVWFVKHKLRDLDPTENK